MNSNSHLALLSPAKLNLFLHINGRLDNGYHELQTLFQFLDYGDDMTFDGLATSDIKLGCNIKELETEDNLVIKAAKLLQSKYPSQKKPGVKIQLNKKLPMGGGVGGGSSNAATTLLALNQLWQLNLPLTELEALGQSLGADVPIFVRGRASIAEGTGEKMSDFTLAERWYLVLTPDAHVNTGKLFASPELPRNTAKLPLDSLKYDGLDDDKGNDFQSLVYKSYPVIAKALDWLLQYAPSRMTGTGACVFSEFETEQQALEIFNRLPENLSGFVAKGCSSSPTHTQLFG